MLLTAEERHHQTSAEKEWRRASQEQISRTKSQMSQAPPKPVALLPFCENCMEASERVPRVCCCCGDEVIHSDEEPIEVRTLPRRRRPPPGSSWGDVGDIAKMREAWAAATATSASPRPDPGGGMEDWGAVQEPSPAPFYQSGPSTPRPQKWGGGGAGAEDWGQNTSVETLAVSGAFCTHCPFSPGRPAEWWCNECNRHFCGGACYAFFHRNPRRAHHHPPRPLAGSAAAGQIAP
eukprot:Hpha_TRINITY_DN15816_c5_g6::TRINITY_DN15816_c5_g6_i1::g.187729::m.187729